MRRTDRSICARGICPAVTAAAIAWTAAAESGESRITSTPAFTARTAASPAEAIFTIAAIFIESV